MTELVNQQEVVVEVAIEVEEIDLTVEGKEDIDNTSNYF